MLVEGVIKRELRELRIASLLATLLAAVALVGCAARTHVPFVPGDKLAGPTLVRSAPSEFDYLDSLPHPAYLITVEDAAYRTVSLAFPSAGENGQASNLVTARYDRSKSKGAKPLVIVLPVWNLKSVTVEPRTPTFAVVAMSTLVSVRRVTEVASTALSPSSPECTRWSSRNRDFKPLGSKASR